MKRTTVTKTSRSGRAKKTVRKQSLSKQDYKLAKQGVNPSTGVKSNTQLKYEHLNNKLKAQTQQALAKYGQIGLTAASIAPSAGIAAGSNTSNTVKEERSSVTVSGEQKASNGSSSTGTSNILDYLR